MFWRIPACSSGEPQLGAADVDGATLTQARRDKEATYPELVGSNRCRLVVVALETGGRWSEEAVDVFRQLAFFFFFFSTGSASSHEVASGSCVGAPLDQHVGHNKCGRFSSFVGGTI